MQKMLKLRVLGTATTDLSWNVLYSNYMITKWQPINHQWSWHFMNIITIL